MRGFTPSAECLAEWGSSDDHSAPAFTSSAAPAGTTVAPAGTTVAPTDRPRPQIVTEPDPTSTAEPTAEQRGSTTTEAPQVHPQPILMDESFATLLAFAAIAAYA
jgi:hypothetical protein